MSWIQKCIRISFFFFYFNKTVLLYTTLTSIERFWVEILEIVEWKHGNLFCDLTSMDFFPGSYIQDVVNTSSHDLPQKTILYTNELKKKSSNLSRKNIKYFLFEIAKLTINSWQTELLKIKFNISLIILFKNKVVWTELFFFCEYSVYTRD